MSYDAEPRTFFSNRTFPTSDLGYNPLNKAKEHKAGLQRRWNDTIITSENTFAYLRAVLGPRPLDDQPNVVDSRTVDPAYQEGTPARLSPGSR